MSEREINRRRVPRRSFESPVGILFDGIYTLEQAYQIGEGGMMVGYAPRPLKTGDQLVASFFLSSKTMMIVRAVIRNVVPADRTRPARYGVEYINLEFQYKREIRNFVAAATQSESA